jgi:hypothetical protein
MGFHNILPEQVFCEDELRFDVIDFHGKDEFSSGNSSEWFYEGLE